MTTMEHWEQVIVEWINCLDVLKEPLKNTRELLDGAFYITFLNLIQWDKYTHYSDQEDITTKFLEDEYPSFKINKDDSTEHIYIVSLLLVHTSQTTMFHTPMCVKLKHETQIRIKTFLENILPLGRDITKETMKEFIVELEEDISRARNSCQTPPLKDFVNSPALRSARSSYKIKTERTRELKELRCNLDLERFKNADLRDDLKIHQDKIQILKKKLKERSAQIKILQEERMKPNTPKSFHKKENTSPCEDYYKKYINDLENQLDKQQNEIENLEAERDSLSKMLASVQRQSVQYKESFINCERSLESLSSKIEMKDRELIELRIHNEELRTHIKEINRNTVTEQSFEVEDYVVPPVTTSLNISEALSSVIEIQLQEAKEETAILYAQVDSLKEKLNILTKDYKSAMELNRDLQDKVKILDTVQRELNNAQKKLHTSNRDISNLQAEKTSLVAQNEDIKSLLSSREEKLFKTEQSNIILSTKLSNLEGDIEHLTELFGNQSVSEDLSVTLAQIKLQVTEKLAYIHKLTDERDSYRSSIENCSKYLKDILHSDNQFIQIETSDLENLSLSGLINYFNIILYNCNTICTSYKCDIEKLKATIDETNTNLLNQQLTVATLREQNQQNLLELTNIEEDGKKKDLLLNEQKEMIHKYSQEIEVLKEIRNEKCILEENVHKLKKDLINQQSILKSVKVYLKNFQDIKKDFKLIKQETQQWFIEHQENIEVMFEKIYQNYEQLQHDFHEVQQEKEKLKSNFNNTKEELSNVQMINGTLQQDLLQHRNMINSLEEREKFLYNELNGSKQDIQELKKINEVLKEQCTTLKIEVNNNLESLKSENAKVLSELKDVTDKYNLLQQEMNDTMTQMEVKNVQISELLSDISSLKAEKDHLICSYQEMSAVKDKEVESKEEALLMLQIKMEKLTNETNASEKKMKEIIINLQEVRSSQDAVLATQETALKEKCLYIEELQRRFDRSKEMLNKELENEKSLHRELQVKFSEIEERSRNQNKNIEELQDKLKVMDAELEASKDHCKFVDTNQAKIIKLCQELEHPTKSLNSTIIETCSDLDICSQDLHDTLQFDYTNNKTENVLNVIKLTLNELHISQKVILHLSVTNSKLNKTLAEQKILIENSIKDKEQICTLKNKVQELETVAQKRNEYLNSLIKNKESLKDSLQKVFALHNDLETVLTSSEQKWNEILTKFQGVLHTEVPVCDEFKQLQVKKANLDNTLSKYRIDYLENIKSISDILWEKFLWTEKKLHDTYLCSVHEKECLDVLTTAEDQFSSEKIAIDSELKKNETLQINVMKSEEEIRLFTSSAISYENGLKSGTIKTHLGIEKKLQNQISQLTKENKDLKSRMDTMRSRNVKLERNMDDLRIEIKKLKSEAASTDDLNKVQSLQNELKCLKEQNQQLHEEKDQSSKVAEQGFESRLKEIQIIYEQKLEDMKQKMKKAYNEQVAKLNSDQEKIVRERLHGQMESMCQKQREEINRYKQHVGDLSSQLWNVGEKLLIEQQQKQDALQYLKELQTKLKETEMSQVSTISHKTSKLEKQEVSPENAQHATHKVTVIKEETFERRQSVRSIQTMGSAFKVEDEDEVFDNVYLADMKRGHYLPPTDVDRLSILQMRNAQCKPHLKSSYPAEMQFLPLSLTEEEIKTGSITEDIFNDSLSQSLLPEQKAKKKDRSQTSYKKPGPPTPSKNGGRLSLQGNELRSPNSRILRERNTDRRITTTPRALKHLFTLKRQDENASNTPKGRRLSNLFRKPRLQSDR